MTDKPDDEKTLDPRETPTPKPRLRGEVAKVAEKLSSVPPKMHDHSEPVDVVGALAEMIAEHEKNEQKMLAKERAAANAHMEERLAVHHDRLAATNKANFHEEALGIASPFLEKFEAWQKAQGQRIDTLETRTTDLEGQVSDHETRLKKVEVLEGTVEKLERELGDVKRELQEQKQILKDHGP